MTHSCTVPAQCARIIGPLRQNVFVKSFAISEEIGGRGGTRTPDPLLAKQVLCQLSYTPTVEKKSFSLPVLLAFHFCEFPAASNAIAS